MDFKPKTVTIRNRFRGIILGTAVGDALGLPAEGLSRQRLQKLFPGPLRHRFIVGRGMTSDDTDHTVFVGQSLLAHPNSPRDFAHRLAWCLRWWLAACPAGIGFATLRSILRLWLGFGPDRSGVNSAGNGPAMRSALIGTFFHARPEQMESFVQASTRITHADPRALVGARAVAALSAWSVREELTEPPPLERFLTILRQCSGEDRKWHEIVDAIHKASVEGLTVGGFADALGLANGVTGSMYHTMPICVYAWYRHFGDFETAVRSVLSCGGDTDTTAAIAGALAGAVVGDEAISPSWNRGLLEWPRGRGFLLELADRLAGNSRNLEPSSCVRYFWPGVLPRNLFFMLLVLLHGLRRLAPPY